MKGSTDLEKYSKYICTMLKHLLRFNVKIEIKLLVLDWYAIYDIDQGSILVNQTMNQRYGCSVSKN